MKPNTLQLCLEHTCDFYGVTPEQVCGESRKSNIVDARLVFVASANQYINNKSMICRFIDKDHSVWYNYMDKLSEARQGYDAGEYQRGINYVKEHVERGRKLSKYHDALERYYYASQDLLDIGKEIEELKTLINNNK